MFIALYRRKFFISLVLLLYILLQSLSMSAAGVESVTERKDISTGVELPLKVELNGTPIDFDQPPVVIDDRNMVPLRPIFEAMGASIEWNANTKTISAIKGETIVVLTIGADVGFVNGNAIKLEVPAKTIHGRAFVPTRFVGESFGATVGWDAKTRTVSISLIEEVVQVEPPVVNPLDQPKAVGQIVTQDGVGIPGLRVLAHARSESVSPPFAYSTDKNGYFTLYGLEENQEYGVSYWQTGNNNSSVISHNGKNYCIKNSYKFTYTSRILEPIVLEQVQLTGKLIDENNKPITDVHVRLKDNNGNFIFYNILGFQTDDEGKYYICGLVANETYKVAIMKLFKSSDTLQMFDYIPLTFTYDPNMTSLPDIKVRITEVIR